MKRTIWWVTLGTLIALYIGSASAVLLCFRESGNAFDRWGQNVQQMTADLQKSAEKPAIKTVAVPSPSTNHLQTLYTLVLANLLLTLALSAFFASSLVWAKRKKP